MERRLKKRKQVLLEALARGVNSTGGLARAVYGASAKNKAARKKAAKLRYYATNCGHSC